VTTTGEQLAFAEPTLTSATPRPLTLNVSSGPEQQPVFISGLGFGEAVGAVTFNGVAAAVTTWTESAILTAVPYGATSGDLIVRTADGREAAAHFDVTPGVWVPDPNRPHFGGA
jgi:hypothetical protein